ncbi:ElyC/SanA/YdcF family protein [Conexibacter sp. JD483]|uniref:SanA/YdcF family protein n=1 Tax=unclassified Conexibacter TaxID=2627773 RepID=UPI002728F3D0|nr:MULTISPECIES: ElyC/SanA/YdcF family protein [unclassified Conexibacter]MDO8189395.1 ElyC/SanA/YdcF family protein [Conexibacter sp. CPCC 205706]MDO8202048.1 ElyC/SanA/YdcF family protein [Conexibacter sp. CPCC 205762]MDR9372693.1 ElyC/SanA/YdcF family protein [Conexibacter sp. JD483]
MRIPLPASRRRRRLLAGVLAIALAGVLLVAGSNALVLLGGGGSATVADAPHAQVALVLGAQVTRDGRMSTMLADRVRVAAELYRAGKVDKVLASGDHGRPEYDEVNAMRTALIAQGVPPRDVFTDHAGFDTWDSAVRAREVFDVSSALVVTQGFHLPRAVWLARRAGLEATGVAADLTGYGRAQQRSEVREVLARVKAVEQVVTGADPRFLGPEIPVSGDGRASLG